MANKDGFKEYDWLARSSLSYRTTSSTHHSDPNHNHLNNEELSSLLRSASSLPTLLLSDAILGEDDEIVSDSQVTLKEDTQQDAGSLFEVNQDVSKDHTRINLSFCGCGFLGMYHVGVASAFHEFAPHISLGRISGVSAGSLVAVAHLCGNIQLAHTLTAFLEVAIDARSRSLGPLHPAFRLQDSVKESLERLLPDDIHLKASGRLHLSLTRVRDGENVIVNQFASKEELIQAILCSCFIPFFSGMIAPKFKGIRYVDGGFSNNHIILDEHTVTISPFAGECDICPQDLNQGLISIDYSGTSMQLSAHNIYRIGRALMPFSPEFLFDQCERGFADAIRYLRQKNLISCTRCIEIRSSTIVQIEEINEEQQIDSDTKKLSSSTSYESILIKQRVNTQNLSVNEREEEPNQYNQNVITINHRQSRQDITYYNHNNNNEASKPSRCYDCRDEILDSVLPAQYNENFAQVCAQLNKGLINWLYSHRPIYILTCMALPYYLPIDISLALGNRCTSYMVGSFEHIMKTCGQTLLQLIQELLIHLLPDDLHVLLYYRMKYFFNQ